MDLTPLILGAEDSLCGTALGRTTAADVMSRTASPVRGTFEPRQGNLRTDETPGFGTPPAYLYASSRVGRIRVEFEMVLPGCFKNS